MRLEWDVAAVAVLMAIWWATETVPVAITALLPLALFPLLGVTSFEEAAVPYANKNISFLGGFMLARHRKLGLHKRIALENDYIGWFSGRRLVGGFMLVAALISMWGDEYINNANAFTHWIGCVRSHVRNNT